jgi:hypothetical protein
MGALQQLLLDMQHGSGRFNQVRRRNQRILAYFHPNF